MVVEKMSFILYPKEIDTTHKLLGILKVTKEGTNVQLNEEPLTQQLLTRNFNEAPRDLKQMLMPFCNERLLLAHSENLQKLQKQRAGVAREAFLQNAMVRHLHYYLEVLKPFAGLAKWYHKIPNKKNGFLTSPCTFSTHRPRLNFMAVKNKHSFGLNISVNVNGYDYPLETFTRNCFLLHSRNEYFIFSYKDYQTLEWLQRADLQQHTKNALAFSQHILQKLEEDYTVNRNNLFEKKRVEIEPVNRVMLSELNNAFVMITPQWVYDGFVIDGAFKPTYETIIEGEQYEVIRDSQKEQGFMQQLQALHPNFVNQRNGFFYLSFADAQKRHWFLKMFHSLLEQGIELTGMDLLQHFRYSPHKAETTIQIKGEKNNVVQMGLSVYFGKEQISLASLQKMLLNGQKAIPLNDDSFGIFTDEWLDRYATIIKHGKIQGKDELLVVKFLAISQQADYHKGEAALGSLVKEEWWKKWQQWQNGEAGLYTVPATVNATLRPYQQRGFEWLSLLAEAGSGACLADDMGLGKTLQAICFLAAQVQQFPGSCSIVICPSSLIYNWQQELQKFTPGITSLVYHGAGRQRSELDNKHQVIITSYGTLRADAELLAAKTYLLAIIDESHNIKNPLAQITAATTSLFATIRIALSGTPVVNNTFDLYAQLNFALPGLFGSKDFFKREYADAIDRDHNADKIKALQKLTAPFILRRTKEQVAPDLPEKNEMILWCSMGVEQQNVYNDIKEQISGSIFLDIKQQGLAKSKLGVMVGLMKLRQVCNSPLLLPQADQQLCKQSIKTDMLVQELLNIKGRHKALVFSQFATMLHLLAAELDKQGITYYHFDGQTPPAKRAEMVKAFQHPDDTTNVFLISLKAGNTGLTLTAADYVFLFDPWWNTAVEQQAIDRTHRIGQTNNVFAYKLICKNTVEEKIIVLQQRKKKLAEELVNEDESFIKSLSEEDIAYLFS